MNQNDGAIQKQQRDGEQFGDVFRNRQDVSMAKTALDQIRDERHNFYGESHNQASSHLFSGDMGPLSNSSTDAVHHQFSNSHNDNGNLRLSMPAPKRTLPSSIVDSLNEDSLFFSGGQPNIFGSGLASPYLHSDTPVPISNSQSNLYVHGSDQADNDSDFDDRGPRSFSLGEDIYPTMSSMTSIDYVFNRSASTPVSASFATSSSQMMHYQNSQNQSIQQGNQNQNNKIFPQRQKYGQSNLLETSLYNSMLPAHMEQDSSYPRTALTQQQQQQQQQQGYLQHPPSNLQLHLADIDRRMEIRRGKSAGPGTGPYDGGGSSMQISGGENMLLSNGIRQSQQQQLQQQQVAFLNGRNGPSLTTPVRSQGLMDAIMIQQLQQRPASTPLPMSMPHNHVHHMQQQQQQPSLEHSHKPHGPPLLNLCGLEDASVEDIVAKSCRDILIEAASHSLKAVELANTLRARVGTEVLAHIRERWGGLLSLLERHAHIFRVERIPKNDLVTLVNGGGVTSATTHPPPAGSQASALIRSSSRVASSPGFTAQSQIQGDQHGLGQGSFYNNSGGQLHCASAPPTLALAQGLHRTQSPPATSSGMGQYSQHYSGGSNLGGEYIVMNGGAGSSGEGTVSRCLHVGNVPANMTETQLLRELERYGDVDCLKLVSQRSRRFAFVSFRTVEQAISAKQRMTRVHPWKSAISFAHKESQSMTMTMTQPLPGSTGSPAPYGFSDQHIQQQQPQVQQQQQYYANTSVVSSSLTSMANQNQNHLQGNQIYQQQQQQQQHAVLTSAGISHANVLNHQSLTALQHQKQQQDEEEELNQLFTRSVSVAPMAPTPSHTRYNIDSVFGANSSTALDAMVNNSSFVPGAGMGIIRPASTGSVNLDGNSNLFNSSFPAPYPFPSSTGHITPMAMPRPRELIAPHYGAYDFQDSSTAPGLSSGQNMMGGGVASISRGMMGSPGPLAVRATPMGLQSPRPSPEDLNLGLDLDYDYDYELLLSGNPPLTAAERDRERATMSLSTSSDPSSVLAQPSSSSNGGNCGVDYVLRRLCDDTYVPTQPWPVRWEVDAFYCSAVVAQLQQFGGVTTISKLRGFLRSRVNATDNIKSVPLKAMLSGYPGFFTVRSNQVTLGPDPLFSIAGGMDAGDNTNVPIAGSVGAAVNIFPSGINRGNLGSFSQGNGGGSDFDLRSGSGSRSGFSPGTSPPSTPAPFGYGMQ